jgi:hypothetical protein
MGAGHDESIATRLGSGIAGRNDPGDGRKTRHMTERRQFPRRALGIGS